MPNFTVKDIGASHPAGLGSFAIETDPAHPATDSEKAYLAKLKDTLATLADAHRQDTNFLKSSLHDARGRYREQEVNKLHAIATDFAAGKIDADAAASATTEVAQGYAQSCPDLVAQVKAPGVLRFAGDFAITEINYKPDGAVKVYTDRIAYIVDTLADDEAADNALVTQGIYIANRDLLKQSLFNVIPKMSDDRTRVVAVKYYIRPGLPPPDDQPSQEKQDFFVQLNQADTVINTVSRHMDDRAEKIEKRWWYGPKGQRKLRADAERQLAQRLLDQYLTKLVAIAVVGLEGPHTTLAKLGLNELRAEFTAQQAGRIKNIYVRSLGFAAATAAAPLLLLYAIIAKCVGSGWWYDHRAFLIAAAGAAIGTWLSFSIRRVSLSFSDLGILEEDLLDPSVRIIFVIALTLTACLLFWTGVMNIEIGSLKTKESEFMHKGSIAMLLGVFFGISERALATAISGRATTFVRGVGG